MHSDKNTRKHRHNTRSQFYRLQKMQFFRGLTES